MDDLTMQRLAAANLIDAAPKPVPVEQLLDRWAAEERLHPPGPRRHWLERVTTWALGGLIIAGVGTATAAAALTALTGSPIPGSSDRIVVSPAAGTTRLGTVRAADPDGGPAWALRVGSADAGLVCLGVGQVQGGRLGLVGLDGTFREMEPAGADDCGVPPSGQRSTVQARTFLGEPRTNPVTVVYGLRSPVGTSVRIRYADGVTAVLPVGRDGSFIVARRGNLSEQRPRIEIGMPRDGIAVVDLAPSSGAPLRWDPERPLVPSEAPR